ncbi:MAG: GTP-binding protein, partial [Longimicrobiales bacterium]
MTDATHYIVATAGHVDHGKSALIKALTGTDPDRLPEEKARGITIDLGFAHLELPSPTSPSSFRIGIVDVPGHEDFVENMVAGVGSIDLALLVVAADDGWMPQTEEHLQILLYLGVRRAVVALTKSDLVEDEARVVSDIRQRLQDTALA